MSVYFDWSAGSPLHPEAEKAMLEVIARLRQGGNPSARHRHGQALRGLLDLAQEQVAALLEADPEALLFTSGATEGAAIALNQDWDLVVQSGLEHSGVRAAARNPTVSLPVRADGISDIARLPEILNGASGRVLVAMLTANSETGVLQPVEEAMRVACDSGAAFLCDATQTLGKCPLSRDLLEDAYVVASAHKLGGPPGVGVLAAPKGATGTLRPHTSTDNVFGIVGFGAAAEAAAREPQQSPENRDRFEERLRQSVSEVCFYGAESPRLAGVSCFSLPGWSAESLTIGLDLEGFSVGAGAACSSGRGEPAWAPLAMGFGELAARSAMRVSGGASTPLEDWERLADSLSALAKRPMAA